MPGCWFDGRDVAALVSVGVLGDSPEFDGIVDQRVPRAVVRPRAEAGVVLADVRAAATGLSLPSWFGACRGDAGGDRSGGVVGRGVRRVPGAGARPDGRLAHRVGVRSGRRGRSWLVASIRMVVDFTVFWVMGSFQGPAHRVPLRPLSPTGFGVLMDRVVRPCPLPRPHTLRRIASPRRTQVYPHADLRSDNAPVGRASRCERATTVHRLNNPPGVVPRRRRVKWVRLAGEGWGAFGRVGLYHEAAEFRDPRAHHSSCVQARGGILLQSV
jgi:hypothetical protein